MSDAALAAKAASGVRPNEYLETRSKLGLVSVPRLADIQQLFLAIANAAEVQRAAA